MFTSLRELERAFCLNLFFIFIHTFFLYRFFPAPAAAILVTDRQTDRQTDAMDADSDLSQLAAPLIPPSPPLLRMSVCLSVFGFLFAVEGARKRPWKNCRLRSDRVALAIQEVH